MRHLRLAAILVLLLGTLVSWSDAFAQPAGAPPAPGGGKGVQVRVVVSIQPLKALVDPFVLAASGATEELAGGAAGVEVLIPRGVSEHGYEIPPATLATLAKADVVVYIGLGLEPQVADFLKDHPEPARRVVEFAKAAGVEGAKHEHEGHDHHDGHDHDHAHDHATDPHLWLDPVLVTKLVPAIRQGVEQAAAAKSGGTLDADVRRRLDLAERTVLARVHDVDAEHRTRLAPHKGATIVVAHDAWGRLAGRYEFRTVAIKGMLANEPTPKSIKAAVDAIRAVGGGARVVFTEPQLAKATSQRIADAAGARLMELDPLGADWFSTMRANLDNIVAALEAQRAAAPAPSPAPGPPPAPATSK